jgi:CubicO group peptidase (beta-lactamase class C family)
MEHTSKTPFAHLGDFIQEAMVKYQVPGVVVGILQDGRMATAGFGVTNVDHPLPVTDETLFQIGSITKTFTATLTMQLVEEGALALDQPVQAHLPDFKVADPEVSRQVTIRHLLTHSSGWPGDVFEDTGPGDDALTRYAALMADLPQLAPLGTLYSYNNANFYLLGHLIETVTGQTYQAALRERVLEPMGLQDCYLDPADIMTYRFAAGHLIDDGQMKVARPWGMPRALHPVGGLLCHVKDLLAYARFQMGDGRAADGRRFLSPESMAEMQHGQRQIVGDQETVGLSWFVNDIQGARQVTHGGGTKGQVSSLWMIPEHQFAMVILTNGDEGGHITWEAGGWVLKNFLGLDRPEPQAQDYPAEQLAPYTGFYSRPYQDINLRLEDGRLTAHLTPKLGFPSRAVKPAPPPLPLPCALTADGQLLVTEGTYKDSRGQFIRRQDGTIGWLRFGGRLHPRQETLPVIQPSE